MALPPYAVAYRGEWACPCQIEWLPAYERHLRYLGIIGPNEILDYAQLIGGFAGSGSTHLTGGAADIWLTGSRAEAAVRVARNMGADATWHRLAGWDGPGSDEHIHSVLRGCPHLATNAKAQISAVDNGGDGLIGSAPDPGPRPLSFRTWREGIEWAQQQEDDMVDPEVQKQLDRIEAAAKDARDQVAALRGAEADRAVATRKRDAAIAAALDALAVQIQTRSGKDQVRKIKELLLEQEATP